MQGRDDKKEKSRVSLEISIASNPILGGLYLPDPTLEIFSLPLSLSIIIFPLIFNPPLPLPLPLPLSLSLFLDSAAPSAFCILQIHTIPNHLALSFSCLFLRKRKRFLETFRAFSRGFLLELD